MKTTAKERGELILGLLGEMGDFEADMKREWLALEKGRGSLQRWRQLKREAASRRATLTTMGLRWEAGPVGAPTLLSLKRAVRGRTGPSRRTKWDRH